MSIDERIDELEFKIKKLHEIIVDPRRTKFNHIILDYNLSRNEVNRIFGLMDEVSTLTHSIERKTFEAKMYEAIPRLKNESHFAELVVRSLYEDGKYAEIYKQLYEL